MKKIIRNTIIITVDENFTVYEDGMIFIVDDVISYIGDMDESKIANFEADDTIDADGNIIMPGLINAHTHIPMTLFCGYGSGLPLKEWLEEKIWPAESKLTPEDIYIGSKMGIAQMLLSGTTCFLDMYFLIDDIAKAIEEMGIRAVLSRALVDLGGADYRMEESIESIIKYKNHSMIDIMVGPHAIYTNSEDSLKKVIEVAHMYDKSMNVHISETSNEVENCTKEHGMTPIEYFNQIGLLDIHTVAAHCVHLTDDDIKILSDKKVSVAHCPSSNLKLNSGISPVQKLINNDVNVALGTDGSLSNNNLDMIEEMHIAALIGKVKENSPTALDAETIIKMATINGAKALNMEDKIGSIEMGKLADLIMIDSKSPFSQPQREYINNIVYSIGRNQIKMTMIAGKILQKDGIIDNIDFIKLNEQFNNCVDRLC